MRKHNGGATCGTGAGPALADTVERRGQGRAGQGRAGLGKGKGRAGLGRAGEATQLLISEK